MKQLIATAFLLALLSPAVAAQQARHADHGSQEVGTDYVNAEVRRIDRDAGKLTLKHEALKQFDMAAMTMVFRVPDPALLDGLAVGDQVRFIPDRVNGQFVVKKIEKRP